MVEIPRPFSFKDKIKGGSQPVMSKYVIEQVENLSYDIEQLVEQGHIRYESSHGIACNYKKFSLILKNTDNRALLGILTAYTAFAEIYLDNIWVDENHRKQGLGRKLIEKLESLFTGKGYNNINLVTSQFQATEFYTKCGFVIEFVRINKHNPKLTKTFFIKHFDDKIKQTQGLIK